MKNQIKYSADGKSAPKLLAILGSPHNSGTTAVMLDCAIEAAHRAGWQVDVVRLYEKNIGYCKGCRACLETRLCVYSDDIQEIARLMKECDRVVLAAPVYWGNVPAIVKNMFDRLLGTAMEETKAFPAPRLKGKEYMLLTACNTSAPFSYIFGQSRGIIHVVKEFFKTAGMKRRGVYVCAGTGAGHKPSRALLRRIASCW